MSWRDRIVKQSLAHEQESDVLKELKESQIEIDEKVVKATNHYEAKNKAKQDAGQAEQDAK